MVRSVVKGCDATVRVQLGVACLNAVEVGGIRSIAGECLDIRRSSECEGRLVGCD